VRFSFHERTYGAGPDIPMLTTRHEFREKQGLKGPFY
jgi:hypothetical protein